MSAATYVAPVYTVEEQVLGASLFTVARDALSADRLARGAHVSQPPIEFRDLDASQQVGWCALARHVVMLKNESAGIVFSAVLAAGGGGK